MRILYCGMQYDYGDPRRGLSFEHTNLYDTLAHMGYEVSYFDFMALEAEHGRVTMNRMLAQTVEALQPDIMFTVLFGDQLDPAVVRRITERGRTATFNWFCDDHWRFERFSRHWAPNFSWISTTDSEAVAKYHAMGYRRVIKTQWACNHFLYRFQPGPPAWDVSFVGQPHGNRRQVIADLERQGVPVYCRGFGWPEGRVTQEELIDIFSRSRINLNLSNAYGPWWRFWERRRDQIKGRNFEVPGCGGFLLTQTADNLEQYFEVDREIVCFSTPDELVERVKYYLDHEEERAAIARAGHERTLRDHTYEKRFQEIFARMGLEGS